MRCAAPPVALVARTTLGAGTGTGTGTALVARTATGTTLGAATGTALVARTTLGGGTGTGTALVARTAMGTPLGAATGTALVARTTLGAGTGTGTALVARTVTGTTLGAATGTALVARTTLGGSTGTGTALVARTATGTTLGAATGTALVARTTLGAGTGTGTALVARTATGTTLGAATGTALVARSPLVAFVALAALVSPAALGAGTGTAAADTSKLGKEKVSIQRKAVVRGKNKLCCGYPLVGDLEWALRFYWMILEADYDDPSSPNAHKAMRGELIPEGFVDLYNTMGFFVGRVTQRFAAALRLEGSALMADGRVLSYAGKCDKGYGTCFDQLDTRVHPFGRGAKRRNLTPFKSVAVDPRLIPIGEPVYLPEMDGLPLPDGSIHDGCVRADDTGGGIKFRKMDFFVVTYSNFRFMLDQVQGVTWITPHLESPRCEYLRDL